MKPLKALIVEDNAFMATILHDMLQKYAGKIAVAGIAKTGPDALSLIAAQQPDVVFLDIELPRMTGFELLQQIEHINFQTVFTSFVPSCVRKSTTAFGCPIANSRLSCEKTLMVSKIRSIIFILFFILYFL